MFDRLFGWRGSVAPERKRSRVGPLIGAQGDYGALAREGYRDNAVVHACVRLIAGLAAQTPLTVSIDGREDAGHPAARLIRRPNPRQAGQDFIEAVLSHLMVAGNAYVEAVLLDGEARELHALRPDRMRVVPGPDGWPAAYAYSVGGRSVTFTQTDEPIPPILHLALFNPLDDHYGLAPIEAARKALDIHNAASAWNKALLDNAARPSGALVHGAADGGTLTDQQFERLKSELEANFQGAHNAGRPLLLEGGLDWRPLSMSPKDMDFIAAKAAAAREIALAFGVPPLLLGLPGDSTHANYSEANRALWRLTVIPLLRRLSSALGAWLSPAFGAAVVIDPDIDGVEALAVERDALWRRVLSAGDLLTAAEKRQALGYPPAPPPDEALTAVGEDKQGRPQWTL
jgi:HK97 family phage portal protein